MTDELDRLAKEEETLEAEKVASDDRLAKLEAKVDAILAKLTPEEDEEEEEETELPEEEEEKSVPDYDQFKADIRADATKTAEATAKARIDEIYKTKGSEVKTDMPIVKGNPKPGESKMTFKKLQERANNAQNFGDLVARGEP